MHFDTNNKIVDYCAKGMELEATDTEAAKNLFTQAWNEAATDSEKFIAAHYLARQRPSTEDKLKWNEKALEHALKINEDDIKQYYPSLYLNIAKCYEDQHNFQRAKNSYNKALFYADYLPQNEYGNMIKTGISAGLERVKLY